MILITQQLLIVWALFITGVLLFLRFGGNIQSVLNGARLPSFYPPSFVFGMAWSILFILFGVYLAQVTLPYQLIGIGYFMLTLMWTPLFVRTRSYAVGFYYLLFVLCLTIILFVATRKWILIPQLTWVTCATILAWSLYALNP